jgi:tRNA-5-methyluridine54 2-sulfurtransferase
MKLESQVKKTLKEIGLFAPPGVPRRNKSRGKKILVALSGGKDSTVTAYLLKKFGYEIEGFHIDLKIGSYSKKCLESIEKLCGELDIKLHVYDIKKQMGNSMCYLRSAIQSKQEGNHLKNCAICGVIKKWIMNKEARRIKATKIATGHNLDDEAQTYLMNIFKGSPKLSVNAGAITKNISDKKFVTRIKPLFYVAEEEIRKYSKEKKLPVVYDQCPCALSSYRIEVRKFLNTISEKEKRKIVSNSEDIIKKIKKPEDKIIYCEICGEPSRNKICKMCEMIKLK